jgi:hypothetical protein
LIFSVNVPPRGSIRLNQAAVCGPFFFAYLWQQILKSCLKKKGTSPILEKRSAQGSIPRSFA